MADLFEPLEPRGDAWEHPADRQPAVPMTQAFVDGYFAAKSAWQKSTGECPANPNRDRTEAWFGFEEGIADFRPKPKR